MNQFQLMARFNGWINDRLYEVVAGLPEEDYRQEREIFFGSIHRTLNHLLVVDRLWSGRMEGTGHEIHSLDQVLYDDFASLKLARQEEDQRLIVMVDGWSGEALLEQVSYRRRIGKGEQATRRDHILLTLFNHQTHHRGQVTALLSQFGVAYPALDLIYFLEEIELS